MPRETETRTITVKTSMGDIEVRETLALRYESFSGQNHLVAKTRKKIEFNADGEWFTPEMANQLAKWLDDGCNPRSAPPWVVET